MVFPLSTCVALCLQCVQVEPLCNAINLVVDVPITDGDADAHPQPHLEVSDTNADAHSHPAICCCIGILIAFDLVVAIINIFSQHQPICRRQRDGMCQQDAVKYAERQPVANCTCFCVCLVVAQPE